MSSPDPRRCEAASPTPSTVEGREPTSSASVTLHLDVRATLPSRTGRIVQRLLHWAGRQYSFEVIARRVTRRAPTPVPVPVSIRFTIDLVPEHSTLPALEPAPLLLDIAADEGGRDPLAVFHTEGASPAQHPPAPGPVFFPVPEEPPLTTGFRLPPGPAVRSLPPPMAARCLTWTLARARAWWRAGVRATAHVPALRSGAGAISTSVRALPRRLRVAAASQAAWAPVMAVAAPARRSGEAARRWLDATADAIDDALDHALSALDRAGSGVAVAAGVGAVVLAATGLVLVVGQSRRTATVERAGVADDRLQDTRAAAVDPAPVGTSGPAAVEPLSAMSDFSPTNEACWVPPPEFHVAVLSEALPSLDAFESDLEQARPRPGSVGPPPRVAALPSPPKPPPLPATRQNPSKAFVGTIEVSSTPVGATVTIDGVSRGATPLAIRGLSAGAHAVRVELDGFERWTQAVSLASGHRVRLSPVMRRLDTGDTDPE